MRLLQRILEDARALRAHPRHIDIDVSGRVISTCDATPVSGASITAHLTTYTGGGPVAQAESARDGTFHLKGSVDLLFSPPGLCLQLVVTHPAFGTKTVECSFQDEVLIELSPSLGKFLEDIRSEVEQRVLAYFTPEVLSSLGYQSADQQAHAQEIIRQTIDDYIQRTRGLGANSCDAYSYIMMDHLWTGTFTSNYLVQAWVIRDIIREAIDNLIARTPMSDQWEAIDEQCRQVMASEDFRMLVEAHLPGPPYIEDKEALVDAIIDQLSAANPVIRIPGLIEPWPYDPTTLEVWYMAVVVWPCLWHGTPACMKCTLWADFWVRVSTGEVLLWTLRPQGNPCVGPLSRIYC